MTNTNDTAAGSSTSARAYAAAIGQQTANYGTTHPRRAYRWPCVLDAAVWLGWCDIMSKKHKLIKAPKPSEPASQFPPDFEDEARQYTQAMFKPITRERFFEIAALYGLNLQASADIWFCRPVDHMSDSEDVIIGNFKLMAVGDWAERMNAAASGLERHEFVADVTGQVCEFCHNRKYTPIHFLAPVDAPASIATDKGRRLLN